MSDDILDRLRAALDWVACLKFAGTSRHDEVQQQRQACRDALRDAITAIHERDAEIARLREALVKVLAHTVYVYPSEGTLDDLLRGLLASIKRIADAALAAQRGDEVSDQLRAPSEPHRCPGCGHRWEGPLHGAELCGDCWRLVQPVLHAPTRASRAHIIGEMLDLYGVRFNSAAARDLCIEAWRLRLDGAVAGNFTPENCDP